MKRKQLVHSKREYANLITRLEAGKSQLKNHEMIEAIAIMEKLEVMIIQKGMKSAVLMIRRNAVAKAKKLKKAK